MKIGAVGRGPIGVDARGTALTALTEEDGSYSIEVSPVRSYLVAVTSPGLAAEPIQDAPIGEGEHHAGLVFRLIEGTRLRGRATFGAGDRPFVRVSLLGEEIPSEGPGPKERVRLAVPVTLDAQGRYEVRLGPGDYEVMAASHRERPTIHVDGGGEFVLNFAGDLAPQPLTLTGTVFEAVPGGGERPAKASISVAEVNSASTIESMAMTDEAGRFTVSRPDEAVGLFARSANGVAAMKVAKGIDEVKVVLGPWATASGRVVDARGHPLVGEGPRASMTAGPGDVPGRLGLTSPAGFGPGGRYEFKGLIPGAEYRLYLLHVRDSGALDNLPIKTFRVDRPGPIDLGEFVVPDAKP